MSGSLKDENEARDITQQVCLTVFEQLGTLEYKGKYIAENCVEGELPRDFSLPQKTEKGKIQFADGAMDGIAMYHMGAETLDSETINDISFL